MGSKTLSVIPWISQNSEIKTITKSFSGVGERFNDGLSNYLHSFWKQSATSFLKLTTVTSLNWETTAIIPKMLFKKDLTYLSNTF